MKNQKIVYVGPAPAVEARYGSGYIHFEHGTPVAVPADLAESLLEQEDNFTSPKESK